MDAVFFPQEDNPMTPRLHRKSTALAVALAMAALTPAAFAQAAQPAQQQAPTQAQAPANKPDTGPAPTTAELQQFADAARDVESIKQVAQPKIAKAKDADARTKLQMQAEKKMEAAVRSHHLTVKRYEQIAMAAQTDPSIRTKLMKLMQKPAKS